MASFGSGPIAQKRVNPRVHVPGLVQGNAKKERPLLAVAIATFSEHLWAATLPPIAAMSVIPRIYPFPFVGLEYFHDCDGTCLHCCSAGVPWQTNDYVNFGTSNPLA